MVSAPAEPQMTSSPGVPLIVPEPVMTPGPAHGSAAPAEPVSGPATRAVVPRAAASSARPRRPLRLLMASPLMGVLLALPRQNRGARASCATCTGHEGPLPPIPVGRQVEGNMGQGLAQLRWHRQFVQNQYALLLP